MLTNSQKFASTSSLGSEGNTSFLRAARAGHLDKVLEHLKQNIDINTSNANGLNALHLASKDGHVQVVEELLNRGAAVDSATKKGNTALHIASLAGQEDVVKLLVNHGASVNVQSQNGFTPLYMAAQENHDNVVKYLLANGANQSLATEDGFTPLAVAMQQGHDKVVTVLLENDTRGKVRLPALHIAAKKDDVKAAKLLLENEHNPDVTSKSGFTPLHIASHYGNESIANLLIQKGADVNYTAKHNISPLHVAAKWGKTNMVSVLLDKGATIESKTRDGLTPLHCAARSGHEQVVDMLLERSAPISSKTKNGLAPLHMAAQGDHVDAARILLYHRAPVDEVTVDYLTALHVAAHCGHARVAKLLLDRGADANARALNGFTPLHIACKKNRIKVVELLLKHGASIGATTESGLTPLHVASFMGCMNIVIYLLQHEANPDVPTVRGETPLHLAARANQTDIIRILLRNGANVDARAREQQTPLHIASRLGNVDIVMLLLQHGAKVDTATKDMYTALHIAAKEGQDEVATALIDNGASLNATTKKGFTPLHLAAKYGNIKVAKLLLQKEAPVDAQGKNGVTPLHVASHYDHQNVALLLLDKGASPHATAKNGHTPLHIAAKKNQMDIANTLLEYGAQPNAESKAGFTPLHLSSQEGHTDMTSLLIEHKGDPNYTAKNGLTPLHLCAQEDRVPVAEVLVQNGAEVDAKTKGGYTPLHTASHYGQANMVKFLLSNGTNVNSTTSIGYTPLHQAAQQGHTNIVNILLENSAQPNAVTNNGQTPLSIAQKLGYISVMESLKVVTEHSATTSPILSTDEKYRVVAPEAMQETFMSDSEEEGGEDTLLGDHAYRYLTADEMKSLGDDSLPIDVTKDERIDSNRMVTSGDSNIFPPQAIEDSVSPQHIQQNYVEYARKYTPDNVDISRHPISIGFLVSFLVDARGGAMRGCRHSGVRVIVPSRSAGSPTRITCRYVRPQRTPHPPPLMEGEALASRVLELGPVGVKFLGPVIIEVPHFAALRGKEREIVILRSDNGETWREHTIESGEDILNDVLHDSFEADDLSQMEDPASGRITRIVTNDFPQYFAVVSRVKQEVHAIGPEGGMVSSTVVPQVQAVFPQGALTKKIKVGLQAQLIDPELTAKLLGHGVAVSPVVTVEPRRRKFHKAITLSMPAPRAHSQGMINQYSGSAPTLRLLCSITGGTTRAQWEDVTGSTPLTFVNDCVSFTTTVSARFWLMDCRNIGDATKMATELYKEAIHVPFMAKFVVFAKRVDPLEARLRVFCMTDDKEDKTLEHQEHFTEVAKSRDVEVLEGKPQYIEFAGNLIPITKSGEQLQFSFRAFRENRLPFSVRVKDQHAEAVGRCLFMKEGKVPKGEPPQQPICILNIVLPDDIISETISLTDSESWKKSGYLKDEYDYYRPDPRLADMSNLLGEDWVPLANQLGLTTSEINVIKSEYPDSVAKQAQSMLRMWISQSGNRAQTNVLENALVRIGREDIIPQCLNVEPIEPFQKREDINRITKEYFDRDKFIDGDDSSGRYKDKYSAEEKIVDEVSDEDENFKKTVSERRNLIEKRLSAERTIPASSQRVEIVQEISSIKRQSLVEDKIAEVEEKHRTNEPTQTITTKTITTSPDGKIYTETIEQTKTTKPQDVQLSQFDIPEHSIVTTTTEVSTGKDILEPVQHIPDRLAERRDSDLLEGVTQRLETTKKSVPRISTESPYSPKLSKTPPPSPADFILRERAATVQEWNTSGKPEEPVSSGGFSAVAAVQDTGFGLTHTSAELTTTSETNLTSAIPKPKPRVTKSTDNDLLRSSQKSPVRDDILDTDLVVDPSIIEESKTYTDKKKFWESISGDSSVETQISPTKPLDLDTKLLKTSKDTDTSIPPPVPKPRSSIPASEGIEELPKPKVPSDSEPSKKMESEIYLGSPTKIMSEYQAQFQDPSTIPESKPLSKPSEPQFDSKDNLESEKGYISDSEDVEHYISDSEIEDRVPQIRTRQMSVFHPNVPARKSMYERSLSLPTEDLYDISSSLKRRKQYFEEQIKKELVEEHFATESEEEASPEHKTLRKFQIDAQIKTQDDTKQSSQSVKDLAKTFDVTSKLSKIESTEAEEESKSFSAIKTMFEAKHYTQAAECSSTEQKKMAAEYAEIFRLEQEEFKRDTHKPTKTLTHKEEESSEVRQSSTESEKSSSPERSSEVVDGILSLSTDALLKDESFSKPSDSMEVHIDKSEVEDSEKITDNEQDATDIETKSLDSLNAVDGSSRASFNIDEQIPEITVTLSGKQRRISEDSEDSVDEVPQIVKPISPIPEITSPICHPEENIDDTVWEVGVQSQPSFEKVADLPMHKEEKIEEDLSGSVQEESDLGSEIHQDHSDSFASDRPKSESHSEIEQIILESLHFQNISPEEAKKIAAELIGDIEVEIQKRQQCLTSEFQQQMVPSPEVARNQVSEYLRHLAETKGLDSREVELVESVLARKQRQFAKLKRDDTQASSMEITDEDLKFSGTEMDFSPSGSQAHILEQLEAEKTTLDIEGIFDAMKKEYEDKSTTTHKTEEQRGTDSVTSKHSTELLDGKIVDFKSTVLVNTEEGKRSEKSVQESITGPTRALHETDLVSTGSKIILKQTDEEVSEDHMVEAVSSTVVAEAKDKKIDKTTELTKLENLERAKKATAIEEKSRISGLYETDLKSHEILDNKIVNTIASEKQSTDNIMKIETQQKIDKTKETKIEDDGSVVEITETKQETHTKTSTSSIAINESHHTTETITTETVQELLGSDGAPRFIENKEVIVTKHEEVRRSLSDDSKSSQDESIKSPEDQFSTCSSGRKGDSDTVSKTVEKQDVILRKTKSYKDPDTSSSSGNLKPDRKSGIDFEAYSSSGESHYHSFELDSKSRPCSSDVEGLMAANSSEYESALTSQDASGKSHISEYQTAASSLSSKESMKSLDSESSGNLASVEVSEMSETLMASELEFQGDEGEVWPEKPTRQSTQMSDSDLLSYPDNEGSMDVSEDEFIIEPKPIEDGPSRMKRSHEMTFQPEPKIFIPESPSEITQEGDSKFATSLDEGSILSMSLSSTSSVAAQKTIIELSRADSEKLELSMNMSGTSEQLSLEDMENLPRGSRESLISSQNLQMDGSFTSPMPAIDSFTSTHSPILDLPLGSVTITSSTIDENGIQSVSTQVTSRPHTPTLQDELAQSLQKSIEQKEAEPKKKGHKRHESTSTFVPSKVLTSSTTDKELEKLLRSDLAESDKYTAELSFKEGKSDEKKDIDEREREESYETEADQGFHRDLRESLLSSTESDQSVKVSETPQAATEPDHSVKTHIKKSKEEKVTYEKRDSHGRTSGSSSEKSSFEEAEAEAAFSMVAHVSPAHKVKQICPILEDEDAEKHELETRERVKKELEERRAAQIRDHSPGSIPDIKVTQHLTPLIDRGFRYPDLELEEQEAEMQDTTPETPASNSSKTSEETDQGKEYILDDGGVATIPEESEGSVLDEKSEKALTESRSEVGTIVEKTIRPNESQTDSPDSDSFEMLEKPDLMDDFVIIEEVAKEAFEQDKEGKSVHISTKKKVVKKHDEDLENFIIKTTSPVTKLTEVKYYPDGSSSDELGFEFDDSPPITSQKNAGTTAKGSSSSSSSDYMNEYDKELEANKKWMEQQFHGDQAIMMAAGYGYEMEFERIPLEDIKEEEITDLDAISSRIGSMGSQKESGGSLGSVKDSFSSTPEYDVLAGRKYFTKSGEHDDVSMSSLQEFENLERAMSLETRRYHQGSQDSSSNGSFGKRYNASKGQGDDVSVSSLKEFEGLEKACIAAHKIEEIVKEEEAMLTQIEEGQESIASESESCETISGTDKKLIPDSDEEDYEKRMFEIDEIIRQAQSNVEKFIDIKEDDKPESIGRGDSLEEVSKIPDLDLDAPLHQNKSQWSTTDNTMVTSTDSLDLKPDKPSRRESTDSLDQKTVPTDVMSASTDSIEFQLQSKPKSAMQSDSIEFKDLPDYSYVMTSSDSLEMGSATGGNVAAFLSDSIDEDGSRIGIHDQSSSSTGKDFSSSSVRDDQGDQYDLKEPLGLDPSDVSSSTATHATCHYETDSIFSGSFTSGGSNTMVSSTDTIDPNGSHTRETVDLASAVRKVWFDDDAEGAKSFTTEYIDSLSKPYVTEVIEPCEDEFYSHTVHRRIELPPEIRKVTFSGPNAEEQMRQYMDKFNEGEVVEESQETDAAGNVHTKKIVHKRMIVKSDEYEPQLSKEWQNQGVMKSTHTDTQGSKTVYTQQFGLTKMEGQDPTVAAHSLLSSIAGDTAGEASGSWPPPITSRQSVPFRAQATRRRPLRYEISIDDQIEVDPREHDWRFQLPSHGEHPPTEAQGATGEQRSQQREVTDQHQLSEEMRKLLEEMERDSKK